MSRLAIALVLLVAAIASLRGGYHPLALLVLEIGAAVLVAGVLWWDGAAEREDEARARRAAWSRLPFWVRHPEAASVVRFLTFGRVPSRRLSPEVEIVIPGSAGGTRVELDLAREGFLFGAPVKRTGLFAPIALVTLWIAASLVPLGPGLLAALSPEAATLRSESDLLAGGSPDFAAPWSLAPYPSLRGLWFWIAVVALFSLAVRAARRPEGAVRLSVSLLVLGAASGILGIAGFLSDLQDAQGRASEALRATGTFGNPNHYAAFQSMLLLSGLGCLFWLRERSTRPAGTRSRRPHPRGSWNDGGLALIAGLAIVVSAIGLLLSLSRSGIAFGIAGAGAFVALSKGPARSGGGRKARLGALLVLVLAVSGIAAWIGIEPLVGRFAGLEDQWSQEATRIQVWRDSVPAVGDYWLTGSGLSSFRYVAPRYRTFGGTIFFSWAHNDYLQLGVELGLPGLVLLLWIAIAVVRAARRARADLASDSALLALHAGAASAVVAMAFHSVTDFGLHLPANFALLALLAGMVVGMEKE